MPWDRPGPMRGLAPECSPDRAGLKRFGEGFGGRRPAGPCSSNGSSSSSPIGQARSSRARTKSHCGLGPWPLKRPRPSPAWSQVG